MAMGEDFKREEEPNIHGGMKLPIEVKILSGQLKVKIFIAFILQNPYVIKFRMD